MEFNLRYYELPSSRNEVSNYPGPIVIKNVELGNNQGLVCFVSTSIKYVLKEVVNLITNTNDECTTKYKKAQNKYKFLYFFVLSTCLRLLTLLLYSPLFTSSFLP